MTTRRNSKYKDAVANALFMRGHATNLEIATDLRCTFPDVSDTTIHRITQRMLQAGECAEAPLNDSGAKRYDINVDRHDHFECTTCGELRDITVSDEFRQEVQQKIGGCLARGPLTIRGTCRRCVETNNQ